MAQTYELDCIVTEITDPQGTTYWLKAWNPDDEELGFSIELEQIVDIMTEIPDSLVIDELSASRDFLVTVHMGSELWVKVTEYESGEPDTWDPYEGGGPVSWENWDAVEAYLDSMPMDDEEDGDIEDEDEFGDEPTGETGDEDWLEGDEDDE